MEAVVFCGIQASGKTTFYLERFFKSHVRLNLDMLKTRHRERVLLNACLETGQRFVVDNTNPTASERRRYVEPAIAAGFRVVGYFFATPPREAIARNESRPERERVPISGLLGTYKRQEVPSPREGFHRLFRVRTQAERFLIEDLE
ncbi:MAG TPA: AAA family ATPase [Thermoleophilaceae bacterium]|nr:AAA family ATPase [Thermoleophilaceae bacterium]